MKNSYGWEITCDESNNSKESIEQGELSMDIELDLKEGDLALMLPGKTMVFESAVSAENSIRLSDSEASELHGCFSIGFFDAYFDAYKEERSIFINAADGVLASLGKDTSYQDTYFFLAHESFANPCPVFIMSFNFDTNLIEVSPPGGLTCSLQSDGRYYFN